MKNKNLSTLLFVAIPIFVSTVIPPFCEYLAKKYELNYLGLVSLFSFILAIIMFIIQIHINNATHYGKFTDLVNIISKDYKNMDINFKRVEENFKQFNRYHEDIKIYMDANTDKNEKLAELVNKYNKERFKVIGSIVEELQDEFGVRINTINSTFESRIHNKHKKAFLTELEKLYTYTRKKLHTIETKLSDYSEDDINHIDKDIVNM